MSMMKGRAAFTLIELLVTVAIIGIVAAIMLVSFSTVRGKARDTKRKAEISQVGKLLVFSCYTPDAGVGTYDLVDLAAELSLKYPQFSQSMAQIPQDPSGNDTESRYKYVVGSNKKCALYANLENENEPVTLPALTQPTPGGGSGVLEASSNGWNGSPKYFQISN